MSCGLKECRGAINSTTGKVEVRAFQVSSKEVDKLKTANTQFTQTDKGVARNDDVIASLLQAAGELIAAEWQSTGDAVFHPPCWAKLKLAANSTLSDMETQRVMEANKHAEYHDPDAKIKAEAARIADMIKKADYCIAFTGAGISTAAGIGDFRGKDGKWTEREKLKEHGARGTKKGTGRGYSMSALRPTYTHDAIVKLIQLGHIKYVISQNTDGLHRLSGIPEQKISELHGNAFVERCEKCTSRYERPSHYRVYKTDGKAVPPNPCERCHINHRTGHTCERKGCGGYLMNTIINFGDYLESPVLDSATENAKRADLVVCLGSTLQVSPANALVEMGKQPPRLVICNRQGTPYDDHCETAILGHWAPLGSRIYGDCDKLMAEVMLAILGAEGLDEWEEGRFGRMREYDKRRR